MNATSWWTKGVALQQQYVCVLIEFVGRAGGAKVCTLLNVATIGGVLACLLRHFRASLASLPLLGQPLGRLPVSCAGLHSNGGT